MNNFQRFLFGILSSFLLAAGFAHAADRLDPVTQTLRRTDVTLHEEGSSQPPSSPPINSSCYEDGDDR